MSLKSSCSSLRTPHLPMPDKDVLYRSFNQLLGSLDLPDDKIEEMNSYDDHKKWEILCSRNLMKTGRNHQSPSFYLQRLRSHVGLKVTQSKTDVTETLRGLEVSLRTYSIEWLRNFLGGRKSLDMLVELSTDLSLSSEHFQILTQCFKVIINDSVGFSAIINHQKLPDVLVRYLSTVSVKNKCNILQLMAMACEKSQQGHDRILNSFRLNGGLEQLMDFLTLDKKSEQMLIVASLNFIKTVVNSPLDLNHQVYLQFEFRKIGLESRIERLMLNESSLISEVIEEIKNYKSMIINVNQLVKDREALNGRLKKAETKLMDVERQSINGERSSETNKKDGREGMSERSSKVDRTSPDADHKPEILQKSTVKISPMIKTEQSDVGNTKQTHIVVNTPPPPPPMLLMPIKKKAQARCKLPSLNWHPLRPNQVRGTIFNGLNDERLRKIINFTHFEDKFHLSDNSQSPNVSPLPTYRARTASCVTLLEPTRQRNVAIVLRKLNFDADVVSEAISDYNFNQLNLDSIQLLTNLAPKDSETEAYRSYMKEKKDICELSEEDKFLVKLSQVERLMTKLHIMDFMGNFNDRVDSFSIQLCAVQSASLSLKSSKKFRSVLEIILTFGNYMNSSKSSGLAYGFRLKGTLEKLNDARSNDKKTSLFEYMVVVTIAEKFPHLLTLDAELLCINEAARVSMKNISSEVASIRSGWRKLTEESKLSMSFSLQTFESTSRERFNKLINELEKAQNVYNECVRYFGEENAETMDSDEFFSIVRTFVVQFMGFSAKVKLSQTSPTPS